MWRTFSDLKLFRRDPLQFLLAKGCDATEPVVRLQFGPKPVWMVTDPAIIRSLLKSDESQVEKGRFVRKLRPIVGDSTLTISGGDNRQRRAVLHAALARGTAQRFVPEMTAAIRETAACLTQCNTFDAHTITAPLTLRLICIAFFGKDTLSRADEQVIVEAVRLVESDVAEELFRVVPDLNPISVYSRRRRRAEARAMMDLVVRRVRDRAGDCSLLRALRDQGLNDVELRDEIVTMLLAGHHTTGSAAAWILHYLAVHPGLSQTLALEARGISSSGGELLPERLPKATISLAFVREVLRLYPSAHWFSRDAKVHLTIGQSRVNRGDALLFSPWHLHRDPRYWSNPDTLDLSRNHAGPAYLPFGAGPRVCIGMGLALLELQLIALEFASALTFHVEGGQSAGPPTASVTLIPPPIKLSVYPQSSRHGTTTTKIHSRAG